MSWPLNRCTHPQVLRALRLLAEASVGGGRMTTAEHHLHVLFDARAIKLTTTIMRLRPALAPGDLVSS